MSDDPIFGDALRYFQGLNLDQRRMELERVLTWEKPVTSERMTYNALLMTQLREHGLWPPPTEHTEHDKEAA